MPALTGTFAWLQGEKVEGECVVVVDAQPGLVLDDFLRSVTAVAAGGAEEPHLWLPRGP